MNLHANIDHYSRLKSFHARLTEAYNILDERRYFTITLLDRKTGKAVSLDSEDLFDFTPILLERISEERDRVNKEGECLMNTMNMQLKHL